MKLYYAKGTIALASHITLEECGASYEAVRLDFSKQEQQSDSYLQVNPKARVPSLVTDRGILTETPAVLLYLAQMFPKAQMAPLDDPFALAQVQSITNYLCSTVHVAHAHRMRGHRWTDDKDAQAAMRANVPKTMAACFDMIEKEMIQGPWVMGEQYTICDPYLFAVSRWLEGDSVDIKQFDKVSSHFAAMKERPATRAVIADHE